MIRTNAHRPRSWTRRLLAVWLALGVLLGGFDLAHAMKSAHGDRDHNDSVVSMVDIDYSKKSEHGAPTDHQCHGCVHLAQPSPFGAFAQIFAGEDAVVMPMVRLVGHDPGTLLRPPAGNFLN